MALLRRYLTRETPYVKAYLAEIAELLGGLTCALFNHWNGCALLSYRTRFWNPIAFLYHWGSDVAFEGGREVKRCGCIYPPRVLTASSCNGGTTFIEVTLPS